MKSTRLQMGMPITVEIVDPSVTPQMLDLVFTYFDYIDQKFSPYKKDSEVSRFNRGEIPPKDFSLDMKTIFYLAQDTKKLTSGYFDIFRDGRCDPSGLVKGWAIYNAAKLLKQKGLANFYIEAGGDIEVSGHNEAGRPWVIGIRHPQNWHRIIKTISLESGGVATSGTYFRGQHIYNPKTSAKFTTPVISLTVVGPDIYQADRFATAAFAMGEAGIEFIEKTPDLEGYQVIFDGTALSTSGFNHYVQNNQ